MIFLHLMTNKSALKETPFSLGYAQTGEVPVVGHNSILPKELGAKVIIEHMWHDILPGKL